MQVFLRLEVVMVMEGLILAVVVVVEGLIFVVVVVLEGLMLVMQIRPDEPRNISSLSAVDKYHSPQSVCVNDDAPLNISSML